MASIWYRISFGLKALAPPDLLPVLLSELLNSELDDESPLFFDSDPWCPGNADLEGVVKAERLCMLLLISLVELLVPVGFPWTLLNGDVVADRLPYGDKTLLRLVMMNYWIDFLVNFLLYWIPMINRVYLSKLDIKMMIRCCSIEYRLRRVSCRDCWSCAKHFFP